MHRRKYYQFTDLTLFTPDLYFIYIPDQVCKDADCLRNGNPKRAKALA